MLTMFQWLERGWLGTSVNNSVWAFAAIEAGHLLALAIIGGAVLVVDMRVLGFMFRRQPVAEIAAQARPWLLWSLVAMIVTGVPLFASLAASKYYVNEAFRLKMYCFGAALLYTFTIRQRIITAGESLANSVGAKAVALGSVLLWSGVGILGRGIGFW